jgi:NAD-dependent dihydropyrimidine dehydrogenase PreA subunit
MCIRCGECFKACPNDVLQVQGFAQGFEGLWTPVVNANWAGCESSCNACGQVCPTGAIRALALEEKRVARMGLAIVNEATCLPHAGREACDLCVQECNAAGYHAIEYIQVGTEMDEAGDPIAGSGYLAPIVRDDKCVGCGLCQMRCYSINAKNKHLLTGSAIIVEAGEGKEDRIMKGSYIALRQQETHQRVMREQKNPAESQYFIPSDSSKPKPVIDSAADDPFGIAPAVSGETEPGGDSDPFGLDGL